MKRLFAMILIAALSISLLAGCGNASTGGTSSLLTGSSNASAGETSSLLEESSNASTGETSQDPELTQSPEEEKVLKIMIVGNSHSNDTFWLLNNVFADQMPDQKVMLGIMYYSGCTVSGHVRFATKNQAVYSYYNNTNGTWESKTKVNLDTGLCDQAWDVVVFQGGRRDSNNEYNLTGRRTLEQFIKDRVEQPYKMMWQITWPSPDDPTFFSKDYPVQPPAGWVEYLQDEFDHDTFKQFGVMVDKAKSYLVKDETYEKVISTGAGVMYAHAVLGVPQTDLWRDYTHLSDFGRLIAAYTFYAQFTGNAVSEINIDVIPSALRQKRFRAEGDLIITEEMKQVIMAAANHALEDPWTAPARPAVN